MIKSVTQATKSAAIAPKRVRRLPFAAPPSAPSGTASPKGRGLGLTPKVILSLALVLIVFGAVGTVVTSLILRNTIISQFENEQREISRNIATITPSYVSSGDFSLAQTLLNSYAQRPGVAYVLIQNAEQKPLAHTFAPTIPQGLFGNDVQTDGQAFSTEAIRNFSYLDVATGQARSVREVVVPVIEGRLGAVRVGFYLDYVNGLVQRRVSTLLAAFAVATLLIMLLAAFFANRLVRPLRELAGVAERVGQGDLDARADVSSTDEIGVLAAAFNDSVQQLQVKAQSDAEILERNRELQANIGNFLNVAMDIASGDFTQRGQVSEDVLGNVVDAINLMVEEIGLVLTEFTDTANSVRSGSGEMLLTTEAIASGAQQQAVEAQRARNQVVQVTGSIQQMARDAEASARAAQQALAASEQGRKAVDDTLGGMQNIRREVQGISKRVKTLGERSLEISEIVETISRISSQTNLLALNAAIEAAGAGEAGQRFSVIADEVRKLAEDTSVATNRVDALIKRIQEEVQEVNLGVEGGTREVEAGYRVAAEAGERLKEVAAVVQQAVQFARSISQATEAQVMSVTEVGSSVQSMATLSESSRDRVSQGREAAENLQELAERLTESLVRFRLA